MIYSVSAALPSLWGSNVGTVCRTTSDDYCGPRTKSLHVAGHMDIHLPQLQDCKERGCADDVEFLHNGIGVVSPC